MAERPSLVRPLGEVRAPPSRPLGAPAAESPRRHAGGSAPAARALGSTEARESLPEPPLAAAGTPTRSHVARESLLKPLALLAVITASLLAFYVSPLHQLLLPEGLAQLRALLGGFGAWTPLVFVGASALGVGFGLPRLAFAGLGGLLFGALVGSIVAQVGTLAGCALAFGWARWLGRDYVQRRDSRRLQQLLDAIRRRPVATNVLLRTCPLGNAFATNLLLGVSPMSFRDFALGTFLGTLPETVVLALLGASVHHGSPARLVAGAALTLALLVGCALARRSRLAAGIGAGAAAAGGPLGLAADDGAGGTGQPG